MQSVLDVDKMGIGFVAQHLFWIISSIFTFLLPSIPDACLGCIVGGIIGGAWQ